MSDLRSYESFQELLKKTPEIEKIFLNFCEFTTTNVQEQQDYGIIWFDIVTTGYNEFIDYIFENKIITKSKDVIAFYIDLLVSYGLIRYDVEVPYSLDNLDEIKDQERLDYYKNLGHPSFESKLILTEIRLQSGCTGGFYYGKYLKDKVDEEQEIEFEAQFNQAFSAAVNELLEPEIKKTIELVKSAEEKINKVESEVNQSITKNIEVLSVFVAVAALLFSNIIGVLEYSAIRITGILIINVSTVLGIIAILICTEVLIIRKEISSKTIWIIAGLVIVIICVYYFLYKLSI